MTINKKTIISFAGLLLTLPSLAMAALTPQEWFVAVINNLLNLVVWPIFIGLSVIMFIWAGFKFLTARGDPGKIKEGQQAVIWAMVGIGVAIIGFSAVNIIQTILPAPPVAP